VPLLLFYFVGLYFLLGKIIIAYDTYFNKSEDVECDGNYCGKNSDLNVEFYLMERTGGF
jgi:hypothetical protein